jgi:hypothetical protein
MKMILMIMEKDPSSSGTRLIIFDLPFLPKTFSSRLLVHLRSDGNLGRRTHPMQAHSPTTSSWLSKSSNRSENERKEGKIRQL